MPYKAVAAATAFFFCVMLAKKEKQPTKGCFSIRKWDVNIFMDTGISINQL